VLLPWKFSGLPITNRKMSTATTNKIGITIAAKPVNAPFRLRLDFKVSSPLN
jgi:hypothetical protein